MSRSFVPTCVTGTPDRKRGKRKIQRASGIFPQLATCVYFLGLTKLSRVYRNRMFSSFNVDLWPKLKRCATLQNSSNWWNTLNTFVETDREVTDLVSRFGARFEDVSLRFTSDLITIPVWISRRVVSLRSKRERKTSA